MSTIRRGVSTYTSSAPNVTHNVLLPTGSQIDDKVIVGASNPSWSTTFTFPGTTLLNAGNTQTMHYGLFKKTLTSTDISQGYLTVGLSTSQHMAAVCVGYSSAGDFGTPGTVWDRNTDYVAYTIAPQVGNNQSFDVLVFSLIKHSATALTYVGSSPSITSLGLAIIPQGPGVPSAHCGVYIGTPVDVTDTWSYASSNGVGFQIAVLDVAEPPVQEPVPEILGVWTGSSVDPVELIGAWNGSTVDSVELFSAV